MFYAMTFAILSSFLRASFLRIFIFCTIPATTAGTAKPPDTAKTSPPRTAPPPMYPHRLYLPTLCGNGSRGKKNLKRQGPSTFTIRQALVHLLYTESTFKKSLFVPAACLFRPRCRGVPLPEILKTQKQKAECNTF